MNKTNTRIQVDGEIWRQARQRALGENKTASVVVEDALKKYLGARATVTVPEITGDATPDFTSSVSTKLTPTTDVWAQPEFRPAPKPVKKK